MRAQSAQIKRLLMDRRTFVIKTQFASSCSTAEIE